MVQVYQTSCRSMARSQCSNWRCKLCSKVLDAHMYLEAKAVHEQFTTDDSLQMLNHEFDSQKNEAMNKAFTKVAPKNMFFPNQSC